jgi:dTDP-glucose 4,6-dehydratase
LILVTGAAGFLGREIVKRLIARGDEVRGVDIVRPDFPWPERAGFEQGDLVDPKVAAQAVRGCDRVIHAAAVQAHTPGCPRFVIEPYYRRNPAMTKNLLDAANAAGATSFVFVSTDMVYGPPDGRGLLREEHDNRPVGPYGRSKVASEAHCHAARGGAMSISILRPSVIIGPGRLGILKKLFDRIHSGQAVLMFGNGGNRHHMIEVGDMADACIRALDRRLDQTFNCGSDDPPTVRAMLGEICRRAGSKSKLVGLPAKLAQTVLGVLYSVRLSPMNPEQYLIAPEDYVLDTTRTKRELEWQPKTRDTDAMWETYRWYLATSGKSAPPAG